MVLAVAVVIVVVLLILHIPVNVSEQPSNKIARILSPVMRNDMLYGLLLLTLAVSAMYALATLAKICWVGVKIIRVGEEH